MKEEMYSQQENFSFMREFGRKQIANCLEKYRGTKALVWDPDLYGSIDLIANYQFLKDRQTINMFRIQPTPVPENVAENIIFLIKANVILMESIANNIKAINSDQQIHIVFVPRRSLLCEMRLKEKGVFKRITSVEELGICWFPLSSNVISLEDSSIYRQFYLKEDPTCLYDVAKAVVSLEAECGFIRSVYGKGEAAQQTVNLIQRLRLETNYEPSNDDSSFIDVMFVIDRRVDLLTPFATQLTYEGLIDELYGITQCSAKFPSHNFDIPTDKASSDEIQINFKTEDEIFSELRDKNFNVVGLNLSRRAKHISAQVQERHDAKDVRQMKLFVDKIPQLQLVKKHISTHTSIAELLMQWTEGDEFQMILEIEQLFISKNSNSFYDSYLDIIEDIACFFLGDKSETIILRFLRIICMQCYINRGFKPSVLESYQRLILQTFGYELIPALIRLEKAGMLYGRSGSKIQTFDAVRKRFNLFVVNDNEIDPTDITYVHSVYAPLSVRLVQSLQQPEVLAEGLNLLPGPNVELKATTQSQAGGKRYSKVVLVLFVGGCTFAEISALRFLSKCQNTQYLIATTCIINGSSFIKSVLTC